MNILFLYYNEGLVLKAYELEEHYFVEFSFLELCKTYPCPNRIFAIELSKGLAHFYTKDLQNLKKMLKFDEGLGHASIQITLDIFTHVTRKSRNNTTENLLITLIVRQKKSMKKKTPSNKLESVLKR